jgi:hypothetical protein
MIKTETWVAWLGSAAIGAAALVTYAYANFETKDHAKENAANIHAELHDMNAKLDVLIGWKTGRAPDGK